MKRFVDGQEVELTEGSAEISRLPDRLIVRTSEGSNSAVAVRHRDAILVSYKGRQYKIERSISKRAGAGATSGEIRAPMPGQIVDVLVAEGEGVVKGQRLLVLEAMKTQQPFSAPFDGTVDKLPVVAGRQVIDGELLAHVTPKAE